MIATDIFAKLIELLQDAVSISIELEDITFDPKTMDFKAGKAKIKIGGANKNEL